MIEALSASSLTRDRLVRLKQLLDLAKDDAISEDDVREGVAAESPELASFLDRLRPKMGKALIWLLAAAIQILATQALAEHRDHSATKQDVTTAVEQAVQACLVHH